MIMSVFRVALAALFYLAAQTGLEAPAAGQSDLSSRSPGSPRLVITVKPEKLVLGESTGATVRARVRSATGTPVEDAVIRLHVNVGTFSKFNAPKPGEISAGYLPPEVFFPQLAVIAAVAHTKAGVIHGWTVLPLWGSGRAEVYSRPQASVKVTIGKAVFGPVIADKLGHASVPVIVPPGIGHALARKRKIDLKVTNMCRVSAIADEEKLVAGGGRSAQLRIYATDALGKPAREAAVGLKANRGSISKAEKLAEGVYRAEYVPPTKVADGHVLVSVFLEGDRASTDQVEFLIVPGAPARLVLQAQPASYTAGQKKQIRLALQVFDSFGNPTSAGVMLKSDLGKISEVVQAGEGRYQAGLSLPDSFVKKSKARIQASIPDGPHAEAVIELKSAGAARIEFEKRRETLVADGDTEVRLKLSVLDSFGNSVPGLKLKASASEGSLSAVTESDGQYVLSFTPPQKHLSGHARLQVSSEGLSASTEIDLLGKVYLLNLSPQVGFVTNFGNLNAPYFSGQASLNLSFLGRGFFLLVEGGYYFSNQEASSQGIKSSLWVAPFTGSLAYRFDVHDIVYLFAAAGGGAYFAGTSTRLGDQPAMSRSTTIGGAQATIGAGVLLGPGRATLQLRCIYTESPNIEELSGNIGGLAVLAGYQFGIF